MDPTRISLFDLADRKLAWIDRRQQVLAEDVANADTPGWQAHDLSPFASLLEAAPLRLGATNADHLGGGKSEGGRKSLVRGDRAPDGNAVSLDSVLTRIAETDAAHELVTDIYKKYVAMFRTALGR